MYTGSLHMKKKSVEIPKGYSESVYRRRTDNTMAKRKKYKRTNNDLHKRTYKTKDLVTRTQQKTEGEPRCSGRVGSSCSTSIRRVNLVTNPVMRHERGKERELLTTSETYPWSFVTQIFHSGQPSQIRYVN